MFVDWKTSVVKMVTYKFNTVPIKISAVLFAEIKLILKFLWKWMEPGRGKAILHGGKKLEDSYFQFKTYYSTTVIKTVWSWPKGRQIGQWNRMKSPKMNPCTYDQLIFSKGAKTIQWEKSNFFSKLF